VVDPLDLKRCDCHETEGMGEVGKLKFPMKLRVLHCPTRQAFESGPDLVVIQFVRAHVDIVRARWFFQTAKERLRAANKNGAGLP
jgi:hypothetical protein